MKKTGIIMPLPERGEVNSKPEYPNTQKAERAYRLIKPSSLKDF